ncbi:MAG: aspartate kinase [Alphaproteobacteria bacterium]
MPRLVMKFGGTSVGDIARIHRVARHVKREWDAGNEPVVVISAMAGETNRLIELTAQVASLHDAREYDSVIATGEQVSSGLVALALQAIGVPARSWLGWQIPIRTTAAHGSARITEIETGELERRLKGCEGRERQVVVVAGFQGLAPDGRLTTLGRGAGDLTAVAMAAALKADRCDIYTDVDGVFTTDPRIVAEARKLSRVTYEEMLEMASLGAKVLQARSVELAMVYGVRLQVLSSFLEPERIAPMGTDPSAGIPGTLVCKEDEIVEQHVVSGITCSRDEAKVTVRRVPDKPGVAAEIFGLLADANVNVDMIVQNISEADKTTDITFTVPKGDLKNAIKALEPALAHMGQASIISDGRVSKISIVGIGMRSHTGVAKKMFETLGERGINIQVISTSEIKVSVLIDSEYTELAMRALHAAYGLAA